jgi:DNA-binding MarR family transcriptional regulator
MELEHAVRKSSALGVIFGQTVANKVGMSSSDLECLDFLNIESRVTAGRLAELTGLTTGAITGMVDRLEKAGWVRRERDENDRRKVFIAIVPENIAKIGRFYEPLQQAVQRDWEGYTDAELKLLLRFMTQGYTTMLTVTEELKARIEAPPKGKPKEISKSKGKRS